jgi:hypothetical protein
MSMPMPAVEGPRPLINRSRAGFHTWSDLSRERLWVFAAVILIVLFRCVLFVFRAALDFDADQAVMGLMAKHLMDGRAFPLFFYGQNYMLGVEAWLAAPMFLVFGVSVTTLKLPLLAINLAVGVLLVWLLEREAGLRPRLALVASLFFLLAPLGTSSHLLETTGGNVEPFLYTLLLWLTRRRPALFGVIFGIGFLQREFTIYALIAVLVIELAGGAWRAKAAWRPVLSGFRAAAEVWLVVQLLRQVASAAGPGTSVADISNAPSNNLIEVVNRLCFDPSTLVGGFQRLATVHWAQLFGTAALPAYTFGLESRSAGQGLTGSGLVLGVAALVVLWRIARSVRTDAAWWPRCRFAVYLVVVGALSAGVYVVGRCGADSALRYDMLSLLAAVGLTAWFLAVERDQRMRRSVIAVVLAWAGLSAVGHGRLWVEYTSHPPVAAKTTIIRSLEARGIKYAGADYWIAYYITFMTNERIIVTPDTFARIPEYERQVLSHRGEAIHISRTACTGGKQVVEGVYFCPFE